MNRVGETRDHYRVGIDECYKLVGLIRTHWRGLSGGTAVWEEIGRFFAGLKERARGRPMPDLSFRVEGARAAAVRGGAVAAVFKLRIDDGRGATPIHAVALRCQIRIEPARRRYTAQEQERLLDLFGTPERWGQTLRPMLWTHASAVVPPFTGTAVVDLPVPCSCDFNLARDQVLRCAGGRRHSALLPLQRDDLLRGGGRRLAGGARSPWEKEATFRLSAAAWKD